MPGRYEHFPPPRKIDLTAAGVEILWSDGHRSVYPHRELRLACRCAGCIEEGTGRPILDPATVPMDVRALYQLPTGNYGIEILWSDKHATGIYGFRILLPMCPCPSCSSERAAAAPSAPS